MKKKCKNFFIKKYQWLVTHNGAEYASDAFKQAREVLLRYRSDRNRKKNLSKYLSEMPFRKVYWVKLLFIYMDSQPYSVLNFMKLYVGLNDPLVSVERSADTQHAYLESRELTVNTETPSYLKSWLKLVKTPIMSEKAFNIIVNCFDIDFTHKDWRETKWLLDDHRDARQALSNLGFKGLQLIIRYIKYHSYEEYVEYLKKWKYRVCSLGPYRTGPNRGKTIGEIVLKSIMNNQPIPEMYVDKDMDSEQVQSESLEQDMWRLHLLMNYQGYNPFTPNALRVVQMGLEPQFLQLMMEWKRSPLTCPQIPMSSQDGLFVGQIHHIPKKGTVKRRPVAVPNRFLQMGMAPCADFLDTILRRLPNDCTFDQGKMDTKIANRVTNPNLYVGSVDLSQATDNLPLKWGKDIWEALYRSRSSAVVNDSWDLFVQASEANWLNGNHLSRWTVGQPLGCLPSFRVLALTHNLFLESLSLFLGFGHSPYCILGDDLLVFNKKLRKAYIREFSSRGIPLSIHKSYEGELVEFAGKTYVRNHVPFYTSDQKVITYGNLFDYQRATTIPIPWSHLPKKVRDRFTKKAIQNGVTNKLEIPSVYYVAQLATIGKTAHPIRQDDVKLSRFFEHMAYDDKSEPDQNLQSGIVRISNHPLKYLRTSYAYKHGWKQRYREVGLPEWYKHKFRPESTDKITRCASLAVSS
jgi:hypothetical protein